MVHRAKEAGKSAAGVNSPSRLFMREIGVPIVEGIALGVSDNADLVTNELDALIGHVNSASIDVSGIVSAMNSIPTQVTAVAPDARPVEIKQVNVTMQHQTDANPAEVIAQGELIGNSLGRAAVDAIRSVG